MEELLRISDITIGLFSLMFMMSLYGASGHRLILAVVESLYLTDKSSPKLKLLNGMEI